MLTVITGRRSLSICPRTRRTSGSRPQRTMFPRPPAGAPPRPPRPPPPGPGDHPRQERVPPPPPPPSNPAAEAPPKVEPLAPSRYKIQFTASAELREKLERLQALPPSDLAAASEAAGTEKLGRGAAEAEGG